MDYKLINEALSDIPSLRCGYTKFKKVASNKTDNLRGGESEGDYDEITEIFSLGVDDLHIKLEIRTDSYGDNEFVYSIKIVKPVVKTITDFE